MDIAVQTNQLANPGHEALQGFRVLHIVDHNRLGARELDGDHQPGILGEGIRLALAQSQHVRILNGSSDGLNHVLGQSPLMAALLEHEAPSLVQNLAVAVYHHRVNRGRVATRATYNHHA